MVKTDVHYPTDINLLWDAIRKLIVLSADLAQEQRLSLWRWHRHYLREFKKQFRFTQRLKHSTSKDEAKKRLKQADIKAAHQDYIALAQTHLARAVVLREQISSDHPMLNQLESWIGHGLRQIDQIERRVIKGEKIPHAEKVFSIFQPHTEWISKGKAGVPVELGLRVCVMEDQHQFILHHQVMEKTTDDKVAISIVEETQARFPEVQSVSMDKGFHSKANQALLKERLGSVVLPKKGRLSKQDKDREHANEFVQKRNQHSAVESAINALQVHGLNLCRDHGIEGFKGYVALAVVSRNIQRLGAILKQQNEAKEKRKRGSYKKAA